MLESVKINHRQSEIRQSLAVLVGKPELTDDETRSMEKLDGEYRSNEIRYRAALISEDTERREAGRELETRSGNEWSELVGKFEMRQVALALDEGRQLNGATAEVVSELRAHGGYRGMPVPWQALEVRAGETVASGTPMPLVTKPIIDRLFATSVAAQMGAAMINIDHGDVSYPVTSSEVAAGWAASETGNVAGPTAYSTVDRPLAPDNTLGIQMRITRKALKQSGAGLEMAVRRDMNGAISEALDAAVFQGAGVGGEPTGVLAGALGWGITETDVGTGGATYGVFREAAVRFMTANAATGPGSVNLLVRPEVFDTMDADLITGTAVSEWDRLIAKIGKVVMSSNALAEPGTGGDTSAILTTTIGGVPPIFVGTWGAIDLIRDPYSDAQSGGLRLTALTTVDVTISRAQQIEILTGLV